MDILSRLEKEQERERKKIRGFQTSRKFFAEQESLYRSNGDVIRAAAFRKDKEEVIKKITQTEDYLKYLNKRIREEQDKL